MKTTRKLIWTLLAVMLSLTLNAQEKELYFVDGYHGGVYGHFPKLYSKFIVEQMQKHPDWKIALEIEPETWDYAAIYDPKAYNQLREMMADESETGVIEYTNPSYAQPYLYNIYGESIIRQFQYGIKKLRAHFPTLTFQTYAVEEPCFTSSIPVILSSFGYKYTSTKNPNTCWGGYFAAYGKDLVNWVGPDGESSLLCSPRYASEALDDKSTWSTTACNLRPSFIESALKDGVLKPVGMCYQDAGWTGGPWIGEPKHFKYVLWRDYFKQYAPLETAETHEFTQEDVKPGLVWGAQVLQRLSQQVRECENNLLQAEKTATLGDLLAKVTYPTADMEQAWRTTLLSQHHDCWIVPYNGSKGDTWADKVADWSDVTNYYCNKAIDNALSGMTDSNDNAITVYNTLGWERTDYVNVKMPAGYQEGCLLTGPDGDALPYQLTDEGTGVAFMATVPAYGYAVFTFAASETKSAKENGALVKKASKGRLVLENDFYQLTLDPTKGGTISSLKLKKEKNKEFIADGAYLFNELRGYLPKDKQWVRQSEQEATLTIVSEGPVRVCVQVSGKIAGQEFTQSVTLTQGSPIIDCNMLINWDKPPLFGKFIHKKYDALDRTKAFYNDQYKLHLTFPSLADKGVLTKNAPFDVCQSTLEDTFYDSWDTIKHNLILNWVDAQNGQTSGLALLSDHTTSYLYGKEYPLGLTVQYIGQALWGRDYKVEGATKMHYALIPHTGNWEQAQISQYSNAWNAPMLAIAGQGAEKTFSLLDLKNSGYELVTAYMDGKDLCVRLFNASGSSTPASLSIGCKFQKMESISLDGRVLSQEPYSPNIQISMPRYGIRTLRFTQANLF